MVSKAQKFRLGVFIVIVSILLLILFVSVAGSQLIKRRDYYTISYTEISVSGLQVGGAVKYHGISIGRIEDISIDQKDVQTVVVNISIKKGTPIKEDVTASLTPVGITGLLQVELSGGSNEAKLLPPGSEIQAGTSIFDSISGQAEVLAEKLNQVLDNINKITNTENQNKLSGILNSVDSILVENREPFQNIMSSLDSTTYYLAQISASSSQAIARLNAIIQSEKFDKILNNTEKITSDIAAADLQKLLKDLNQTILEIDQTFSHIDQTHLRTRQDLVQSIESLRETLDYLNEFSRLISENPSLLLRSRRK